MTTNKNMNAAHGGRPDMKWHAGSLMRILDTADFQNEMVGIEFVVRRGFEPPAHSHTKEDEAVYVLRGEVEFTVGSTVVRPALGEWAYLPKAVPHSFRILSEDAHMLHMYTPGGIEMFFQVLSEPTDGEAMPAGTLSYENLFDMEYIAELGRQFGLKFFPAKPRVRAAAA